MLSSQPCAGDGTELAAVKGGDFPAYLSPTAPSSSNDSRTIAEDTQALLATDDFGSYSDPSSIPLAAVKITTLASAGNVTLTGIDVKYIFPSPLAARMFVRLKVTGP